MPQGISAFYYIKNNKRRVAVLVVSLAMFFLATYLTMFLLSTTSETFEFLLTETTKYLQYIRLTDEDSENGNPEADSGETAFNVESAEETSNADSVQMIPDAVYEKYTAIADALEGEAGVKDVFLAQVEYFRLKSVVGEHRMEIPLVNEEDMEQFLNHMGAVLVEGRLPEHGNEVVLDKKMMKNAGYQIGDTLKQNEEIKIVGIIKCSHYFGCGMQDGTKAIYNPFICILSDGGMTDLRKTLEKSGIRLETSDYLDAKKGQRQSEEITGMITGSTDIFFVGITLIVAILVVIVTISYMRDRRSEWCLYSSIGYGRKSIYFLILRELLFVFVFAIVLSALLCVVLMKLMDVKLISELGLKCAYFLPETLIEILCAYVALFGVMQIPMRIEIHKIKTIDAIDDDM